jgi:hypothetical protein
MQWKPDVTSGTTAQTPFARLFAWRTSAKTETYSGQVMGLDNRSVALLDGHPTEDDAQRWAELAYAKLLRKELDALGLLDALDFVD